MVKKRLANVIYQSITAVKKNRKIPAVKKNRKVPEVNIPVAQKISHRLSGTSIATGPTS